MRRTVLSAMALACTAVLASTVPAFADGATPSPVPTTRPAESAAPSRAATPAPTRAPRTGEVSAVPEGAPDTGAAPVSESSGSDGTLIGGGAAAMFAGAGAAVYLVRRRRATGV
ncbi:sortase-dependent protein [Streptomyces sp. NPDC088747]|uniref:sortase-dependent protein n=1 Tax=Streptomyces sp. NPDC088747 TaxID=3365886 RepID=UPI0037F48A8E